MRGEDEKVDEDILMLIWAPMALIIILAEAYLLVVNPLAALFFPIFAGIAMEFILELIKNHLKK